MFLFLQRKKNPNVVLGTCIGDALGVPFEGMQPTNKKLLDWNGKDYNYRPATKGYIWYGDYQPGQFSDDGQMTIMVAESLIANKGFDPKDISERYVDWIYSGRARGFGRTTKAAVDNLHNGVHWSKSGIEGSYGNGTAMRAAPFGVFFADDLDAIVDVVKIDSAITHRSVEAEAGALAIALSTALIHKEQWYKIPRVLLEKLPDSTVKIKINAAMAMAFDSKISPTEALRKIGTSANVKDTVPAAIYCYFKFDTFADGVVAAIRGGRDADTTGAIVGALFGADSNLGELPSPWVKKVESYRYLMELDSRLADNRSTHHDI